MTSREDADILEALRDINVNPPKNTNAEGITGELTISFEGDQNKQYHIKLRNLQFVMQGVSTDSCWYEWLALVGVLNYEPVDQS